MFFIIASVLPGPDQNSSRKDLVTKSFENTALDVNQEPEFCCKNLSNGVTSDCMTDVKDDCVTKMNTNPQSCQTIDTFTACHDATTSPEQSVTLDSKKSDDCVTKPKPSRPQSRSDWLKTSALYKVRKIVMRAQCAQCQVKKASGIVELTIFLSQS